MKVVANMKIMHVQSVLPERTVIELKIKTGESSTKEAISKAVYHYLECNDSEQT
jgi:hypothetical protein